MCPLLDLVNHAPVHEKTRFFLTPREQEAEMERWDYCRVIHQEQEKKAYEGEIGMR